jgi:hypothetical protein
MLEASLRGTLITWYVYRIICEFGPLFGISHHTNMHVDTIALCFVKLSILFFYRTIASQTKFRRLVYASIITICLYTFAVTVASIFQCDNPSDAWSIDAFLSQFDGVPGRTKKPKCFEPTKLWVVTGALNLFSDVVILLLPIPTLLGLRVPINKRLALIGIFSIGIMAIVASCVRMWVMALWSESPQNSAQFGADLLLWGQVETNSGIISASVPFLRLIFRGRDRREVSEEKQRVISPPKPESNNKPLQIDSMAFFSGGEDGPNGSPVWKPFITVPASLSSGSRGSAQLEVVHPYQTV